MRSYQVSTVRSNLRFLIHGSSEVLRERKKGKSNHEEERHLFVQLFLAFFIA